MLLKSIISICAISLIAAVSIPSLVSGDDVKNSKSQTEAVDYEELLAPYQKVFDDFNKAHGTTYGFMTDEQLVSQNIDRQEYLHEMVNVCTKMTIEEFNDFIENAYNNDVKKSSMVDANNSQNSYSLEKLPYYEPELSGDIIEVVLPSDAGVKLFPLDKE